MTSIPGATARQRDFLNTLGLLSRRSPKEPAEDEMKMMLEMFGDADVVHLGGSQLHVGLLESEFADAVFDVLFVSVIQPPYLCDDDVQRIQGLEPDALALSR